MESKEDIETKDIKSEEFKSTIEDEVLLANKETIEANINVEANMNMESKISFPYNTAIEA